ncbi:MAG: hypothetical protein Q7S22_06935 [Candidatus Micrarchaeota archaeon]|nr:hypothetical protein [Candidatus Micrarchaeota archaeon]
MELLTHYMSSKEAQTLMKIFKYFIEKEAIGKPFAINIRPIDTFENNISLLAMFQPEQYPSILISARVSGVRDSSRNNVDIIRPNPRNDCPSYRNISAFHDPDTFDSVIRTYEKHDKR